LRAGNSPLESCKSLCNFIRSARSCFVSCVVFHSFVFHSCAHGLHSLARSLPFVGPCLGFLTLNIILRTTLRVPSPTKWTSSNLGILQ
jgi:hypothetical protein